jgi:hypothetical protein
VGAGLPRDAATPSPTVNVSLITLLHTIHRFSRYFEANFSALIR